MSRTMIESTTLRLPSAELGAESPLPSFGGLQRLPDPSGSPGLPPAMRERIAYGRLANPLPYAVQNGYGRDLRPRQVPAIRLANDHLDAYVLPELGGRIWSLRDRRSGRELVFANERLQYANFALTDAWCAGGIEWNLGSTGHATTTSRPVFAARVETARGPSLRLWEWERTRDLVFSVDLMPAGDVPVLVAHVRVRNPDPEPKPLYWWTNIAVPETDGVRVLAPADRAWRTANDGSLDSVPVPHPDTPAVDASYPRTAPAAADYFFQISEGHGRWVAAIEEDGRGVAQTATAAMAGRKFFLWGAGAGGERWQEWLSGPHRRYLEIQAGLATTQLEHLALGPDEELSWAEAYVPLELDPARAHGGWVDALDEVDGRLADVLPAGRLDEEHQWWRAEVADRAPAEQLAAGSGAGLAELTVRGIDPRTLPGTPFDRPRRDGSRFLVELARGATVDQDAAGAELLIPPVSARWRPVFDRVADGWWGSLMRAVRAHAAGDLAAAERCYRDSHVFRPSAWAARGLALLSAANGDAGGAIARYRESVGLAPECLPLLVEATEHCLAAGQAGRALALVEAAPEAVAGHGRVRLLRCRALLGCGRTEEARAILGDGIEVPDLREGETLEAVWRAAFGDAPLDPRYDFRMGPSVPA
ncbi:DUF5107 domain-containing protein [Microlunatus ginsengisoli]